MQGPAANRQLRSIGCDLQYLSLLPDGETGQPFRGPICSLEGRDVTANSGFDDAMPFEP